MSKERVNILAVDDKPANLLALENILHSPEINVVRAISGNEALAHLLEMEFACVLLDVKIPDIDGFELARIIRKDEKTKYLPIIFISGHKKGEEDISRGYELGAVDYLLKPVEPNSVRGKVSVFAELYRKERERRRTQEALTTIEKRTRAIIENATDAFVSIDQSGLVTEWNRAAEQTFGWKMHEILGKKMVETIIPPRYREAHYKGMERFLKTGEGPVLNKRLELSALHKDGREFPIEICISEAATEDGVAFFAFIHDISERKHAEEEIRTAKEELERRVAERTTELTEQADELKRSNEELGRFAYVSSHDLKEPLRMVSMYVQILTSRHSRQLNEEAKACLKVVVEGATRMQQLIDDLLIYARVGRGDENLISVDCTKVLDRVVENLRPTITENRAEIRHGRLPTIEAREAQIAQVFQNLIGNAIKFCGEASPRVHIESKEVGEEYQFSIRDSGIGIKLEYHKKIFEIFQRLHTREQYPGTGIGLSVCKKIIEMHGGKIWVESEEGKGTAFYFTLPKVQRRGHY